MKDHLHIVPPCLRIVLRFFTVGICILIVSCRPELISGQSSRPVPTVNEYKLDRSDYAYESDPIPENGVYVRVKMRDESDPFGEFSRFAYRFANNGVYQYAPVSSRYPSASEFNRPTESFYGIYGVSQNGNIMMKDYSRIDRVFKKDIGVVREDTIDITHRQYVRSGLKKELRYRLVRTDVEFIEQIPLAYPGEPAH